MSGNVAKNAVNSTDYIVLTSGVKARDAIHCSTLASREISLQMAQQRGARFPGRGQEDYVRNDSTVRRIERYGRTTVEGGLR